MPNVHILWHQPNHKYELLGTCRIPRSLKCDIHIQENKPDFHHKAAALFHCWLPKAGQRQLHCCSLLLAEVHLWSGSQIHQQDSRPPYPGCHHQQWQPTMDITECDNSSTLFNRPIWPVTTSFCILLGHESWHWCIILRGTQVGMQPRTIFCTCIVMEGQWWCLSYILNPT